MQLDNELPRNRKHIWAVAVAILMIFLPFLYFIDLRITRSILPNETGTHALIFKSILENMIGGIAAAFVLAVAYRWVIQWINPADRVLEIGAEIIGPRLRENARSTKHYTFIGNTATFVTASILPILCSRATESSQLIVAKIFIIDPRDERAIDAYVRHKDRVRLARSHISDADDASWTRPAANETAETALDVKIKLYTCIYLCAYAAKIAGVSLNLYLRPSFTPFRADVSDKEAILTQESASESAVAFSSRGHFYGWYNKEAEALEQQCAEIRMSNNKHLNRVELTHPNGMRHSVKKSLQNLVQTLPMLGPILDDAELEAVVKRIANPRHSY